jgi:hypothetical protein
MATSHFLVVYADESCLGNQNEGPNPGGAAIAASRFLYFFTGYHQ